MYICIFFILVVFFIAYWDLWASVVQMCADALRLYFPKRSVWDGSGARDGSGERQRLWRTPENYTAAVSLHSGPRSVSPLLLPATAFLNREKRENRWNGVTRAEWRKRKERSERTAGRRPCGSVLRALIFFIFIFLPPAIKESWEWLCRSMATLPSPPRPPPRCIHQERQPH